MSYRYRVLVENFGVPRGGEVSSRELCFEAKQHDDLFAIVDRVRQGGTVSPDEAESFAVGLKLFSEVALKHRKDPLFAEFMPHLGAFIQGLKRSAAEAEAMAAK